MSSDVSTIPGDTEKPTPVTDDIELIGSNWRLVGRRLAEVSPVETDHSPTSKAEAIWTVFVTIEEGADEWLEE